MTAVIKAKAGSLATALALAVLPVDKQATQSAALGAVHLSGEGDRLHVTMTAAAGTITTSIEAEATGEMALPMQRFAALVAAFPANAQVDIRVDDNVVTVGCGRSKFRLPIFPLADLPARHVLGQETGRVELDPQTVRDLISRLSFAIETERTRFYLTGILLHNVGGELVAIATDGRRLAQMATPAGSVLSIDRTMIIPREVLRPIQRLLGKTTSNITIRRSERLFAIDGATFQIVGRLIDGVYPDTTRLTEFERPNVVTTDRARLCESLERFAAIAQDATDAVRLYWDDSDSLRLSAADTSSDDLAADVTGNAEVSARGRYLSELLQSIRGANVTIATGGPGYPILIRDPDDDRFIALQMPVTQREAAA